MDKNTSILDMLLRPELPNVQKELPTAKYKVKRLSKLLGAEVVFSLKALPYGRVEDLRQGAGEDMTVQIVLSGVADPNLKAPELAQKYGGVTPAETLKAMLLPGEIEDLSRAIERLCGYRMTTIEEVKNA
ncbi:hypothetical protein SDC9_57904 [bioreactor metagenome]|uniref:Phage XkdN-like protein n=1 Tax=bioreactor metagenome TaxID=1076179 RepID=A0A644X6X4_9ZZZZ